MIGHAESFRAVTDSVVAMHEEKRGLPDSLLFPNFNNHRHFIELRLKDMIRYGLRLGIVKRSKSLDQMLHSHSLHPL